MKFVRMEHYNLCLMGAQDIIKELIINYYALLSIMPLTNKCDFFKVHSYTLTIYPYRVSCDHAITPTEYYVIMRLPLQSIM